MTQLKDNLAEITAHIVAAYVEKNPLPAAVLPDLIASVSNAIGKLSDAPPAEEPKLTPAVNPKKSVSSEHIVCLEDGKVFTSLKRHLRVRHGLTPEEYRAKWNLPADYPMVAPNFTAVRSDLAKKSGFGRKPAAKAKPTRKARPKQAE